MSLESENGAVVPCLKTVLILFFLSHIRVAVHVCKVNNIHYEIIMNYMFYLYTHFPEVEISYLSSSIYTWSL